jgi:hypothetical protein
MLLVLASAAHAGPITEASANVNVWAGSVAQNCSSPAACALTEYRSMAAAAAWSQASPGAIAAGVQGGALGAGNQAAAWAASSFRDTLTISGGTGPGALVATVLMTGGGSGSLQSGGRMVSVNGGWYSLGAWGRATHTLTTSFTFGQAFDFILFTNLRGTWSGSANEGGSLQMSAAVQSLRVLDGQGREVNFTLTSESGHRYGTASALSAIATPEPGTWALVGLGLAAAAVRRWRQRGR